MGADYILVSRFCPHVAEVEAEVRFRTPSGNREKQIETR